MLFINHTKADDITNDASLMLSLMHVRYENTFYKRDIKMEKNEANERSQEDIGEGKLQGLRSESLEKPKGKSLLKIV